MPGCTEGPQATTSILDRSRTIARPGFNRWLVPPTALAIHLAIGQAYAFSVFNLPLARVVGITESAPADWKLSTLGWIFSLSMVFLGLSAAVFGTWLEAAGPRKAMFAAACCFGGGCFVSALGVWLHQIWLLYLGYGVLGGIGLGLGYISPVSTLIKWFPDRPGMASGMAIMGFGGGALIGAPLARVLMAYFRTESSVAVAETFLAMGAIYFCFMLFGVFMVRLPPPGWRPSGYAPRPGRFEPRHDLTAAAAITTLPFWFLWLILLLNVTAGIGVLGQASPMIQEMFPDRVTPETAAGFVGLLSLFNMLGRFAWSSTSDVIGRKKTYTIFFLLGALLYGLTPQTGRSGLVVLFVLFYCLIMTMYGGGFATIPAYLRDLFGTMQVGAIHGRLLTAWSVAGIVGPVLVNYIREHQIERGLARAEAYTVTMYLMTGLLLVGFVCNLLVRAVNGQHIGPAASALPVGPAVPTSHVFASTSLAEPVTGRAVVALLLFSWLWVGIPLIWGVWNTLQTSLALFR